MLIYLYTGQYSTSLDESWDLRQQLRIHSMTYVLADKYDIPVLMEMALIAFKSTLSRQIVLEDFLSVVSDVYTTLAPSNALQLIIVEHARSHLKNMTQSVDNLRSLQATLQEIPDFAFEVLRLFMIDPIRGRCSSCGPNNSGEVLQARCKRCGRGGLSTSN